jgi:uncharacterized membrane protein YkgB
MTVFRSSSKADGILKLSTIDAIASFLGRYGLVIVIGWIGALKFANFEAHQIQPLVANSPFMGWLYDIFPAYTFSALLGVFEVTAAVLLAIKTGGPEAIHRGQLAGHSCFSWPRLVSCSPPRALASRLAAAFRPYP